MTLFISGLKQPIYDIGGKNTIPTNRLSNMTHIGFVRLWLGLSTNFKSILFIHMITFIIKFIYVFQK